MPDYTIQLRECRHLARDTYTLTFDRPPGFTFVPGQYIRFRTGALERDYTLTSSPDSDHLEIFLRLFPEGRFTPQVVKAPVGETFAIKGPLGYFRFQSDPQAAVLLATGTGVAPFLAFARAGVRGFTLLQGAAEPEGLYFSDELRRAADRYWACLSGARATPATAEPAWQFRGRITDRLALMPPHPYHFYLCGSAGMVRDVIGIIDRRFPDAVVFTETFY